MHNIENRNNTLTALMERVASDAAKKADFLTPTTDVQKITHSDTKSPAQVIEAKGGEPTRILDVNSVAFGQIATHCEIDTRTARRLQEKLSCRI